MINKRILSLTVILILAIVVSTMISTLTFTTRVNAAAAPTLGTAASYAVLGGSTVTNTGTSVINGNLGVSPGSAVTGFPPGIVTPPGTIHAADAAAAQAQIDVTTAYNALDQPVTQDLTGMDLGGLTLTPGVYSFDTSAQLTGTLTLNALNDSSSVFIFKIGSTLTTASGSSVVVINAPPNFCNKYWRVGSSAILGTSTSFEGNILALTSITMNTGASLYGRALARNGAVTLDSNRITVPGCDAHLSLIKTVSPGTYSNVGDTLTYTIIATNDGIDTLTNVTISDPGLAVTSSTPAQGSTLAPGATMTVVGTRAITQTDIDNLSLTNIATASGSSSTGTVSATATATATAFVQAPVPHLSLTKVVFPATYSTVGDILTYTLVATNDGNETLTNVTISDPGLTVTSSTPAQGATLLVGETMTVIGTRIIIQADLDNLSLTNTATASGTSESVGTITATASATATAQEAPLLSLTKTVFPATYKNVGDILTYTLVATNVGNVILNNVTISDPGLTVISSTPSQGSSLVPGAIMTVIGTRTITQADLCSPASLWAVEYRFGPPAPGYKFLPNNIFKQWLQVRWVNDGPGNAYNVKATITNKPVNVTVVDGKVNLGTIPAGGTAWSTDTFTLCVDLKNPQNPQLGIVWKVEYDDKCGDCSLVNTAIASGTSPTGVPVSATASATATAKPKHHVIYGIPKFKGEPPIWK